MFIDPRHLHSSRGTPWDAIRQAVPTQSNLETLGLALIPRKHKPIRSAVYFKTAASGTPCLPHVSAIFNQTNNDFFSWLNPPRRFAAATFHRRF